MGANFIPSSPMRNFTKARALLVLKQRLDESVRGDWGSGYAWVSVPELAFYSGAPAGSLRLLLPRWVSRGFVTEYAFIADEISDSRPHSFYRLAPGGAAYLAGLPKWYPHLDKAQSAIAAIDSSPDAVPYRGPSVKHIAMPAYPGSTYDSVSLRWPFSVAADAYHTLGFGGKRGFVVFDILSAVAVAQNVFRCRPSKACLDSAAGWQRHLAAKGKSGTAQGLLKWRKFGENLLRVHP